MRSFERVRGKLLCFHLVQSHDDVASEPDGIHSFAHRLMHAHTWHDGIPFHCSIAQGNPLSSIFPDDSGAISPPPPIRCPLSSLSLDHATSKTVTAGGVLLREVAAWGGAWEIDEGRVGPAAADETEGIEGAERGAVDKWPAPKIGSLAVRRSSLGSWSWLRAGETVATKRRGPTFAHQESGRNAEDKEEEEASEAGEEDGMVPEIDPCDEGWWMALVLCQHLTALDLSYNELAWVPRALCALSILSSICLAHNNFTAIPITVRAQVSLLFLFAFFDSHTHHVQAQESLSARTLMCAAAVIKQLLHDGACCGSGSLCAPGGSTASPLPLSRSPSLP